MSCLEVSSLVAKFSLLIHTTMCKNSFKRIGHILIQANKKCHIAKGKNWVPQQIFTFQGAKLFTDLLKRGIIHIKIRSNVYKVKNQQCVWILMIIVYENSL